MFAPILGGLCAGASEFYVAPDGADTNVGYCHIDKMLDKGAVYDPKTVTELICFNTGKLVFSERIK